MSKPAAEARVKIDAWQAKHFDLDITDDLQAPTAIRLAGPGHDLK